MFTTCIKSALVAAWVLALVGCGGGGSGGEPTPPAPTVPVALALVVEVGGVAATPDGTGTYVVRPGRAVAVKANRVATWTGDNLGSAVTRTDTGSDALLWASRFGNPGAVVAGAYEVTARATDGSTQAIKFSVQPVDQGNGDYMVFAANGSRQTLSIDFDAATYTMTDTAGGTDSGTLSDPIAPMLSWTFRSGRITGINTATFRRLGDNIVGGFPMAVPFGAAGTYATYPFIASRGLLTTQASLDGAYDRAGISYAAGGKQSTISQIGVTGGGTVLQQCVDIGIFEIANCPPASLVLSDIEADPVIAGTWLLKEPGTGTVQGRFAMAQVEGENIYLSAGVSPADGSQVLRVGVPAGMADLTFGSSHGWSTVGTLDVVNATPSDYNISLGATGLSLTRGLAMTPVGIRTATRPGQSYFTMRSQRLELLIAARNSPAAGFLHIGVVD